MYEHAFFIKVLNRNADELFVVLLRNEMGKHFGQQVTVCRKFVLYKVHAAKKVSSRFMVVRAIYWFWRTLRGVLSKNIWHSLIAVDAAFFG